MTHKKIDPYMASLDYEEKELLKSYEKGEWKTVPHLKEEMLKAKKAAENYLRKNTRVNIRISSSDLKSIKQKAVFEGLPYQTLLASIIHKYAVGRLHESLL